MKTIFYSLITLLLMMSSILEAQTLPSYVPTNGLLGYWPFNGNANDESGNGNNGAVNGAALASDRNGNPNSAYYFDGIDDYIEVLHNSSMDFSTNNKMTISFWMSLESYPPGSFLDIIISKQSGSGVTQSGFNVSHNSTTTLGLTVGGGNGNLEGIGVGLQPLNQWHHVTLVWNNTTCLSYLDGVLFNSLSCSQTIGSNTENLLFGKPNWTNINAQYFNGMLDGIGIWDRALSQQEITNLYNNACTTPTAVRLGTDRSTILCPNDSVNLFVVGPKDPSYTYQWVKNNVDIPGATADNFYAKELARYKVKVISGPAPNCRKTSGIIEPTAAVPAALTITPQSSTSICQGDSVLLSANVLPGYTYEWRKFGVLIPGANSPDFYAKQAGLYKVKATSLGGCVSNSNTININITCRISDPNAVNTDIMVYPNPANNQFTIKFGYIGEEKPVLAELRDKNGRLLEKRNLNGTEELLFNTSKLATGNYTVRVLFESGDSLEKVLNVVK